MPVGTPHHAFHFIPFTALPHLSVPGTAPPAFSLKYLIAFSTNNCKRIGFCIPSKRICPMLLQIPFSALYFQLYTFPNLFLNYRFVVILNIILLDFPLILYPFLREKICRAAFLQKGSPFIFLILQHTHKHCGLSFCAAVLTLNAFPLKNPLDIIGSLTPKEFHESHRTILACFLLTTSFPFSSAPYPRNLLVLILCCSTSNRLRISHVLFSEIFRLSSCASKERMVSSTSTFASNVSLFSFSK